MRLIQFGFIFVMGGLCLTTFVTSDTLHQDVCEIEIATLSKRGQWALSTTEAPQDIASAGVMVQTK